MKQTAQLVKYLLEEGIGLSVAGESLEVTFSKEPVDDVLVELIRNHKADIMAYLQSLSTNDVAAPIPKISLQDSYPVSAAQQRLWVLSQFEEASLAYNLPLQWEWKEALDMRDFEWAIQLILERHEILRTVFRTDEQGDLRQHILSTKELGFQLSQLDLRQHQSPDQTAKAYIEEGAVTAFDLENGPLLRAAILQLADEHYLLCLNMHHIISDAWSMKILLEEVISAYKAFQAGSAPVLTPLRIQHKDYVAWQVQQFEQTDLKQQRAFWLEKLVGGLPRLELPGARQRPQIMTYKGESIQTYIPAKQANQLRTFSQQRGGSLFMGLLSICYALLHRYTGQSDLPIGTPIAGRKHVDLQNQIGFFLNTLVLRQYVEQGLSFQQLFDKVKDTVLSAYGNQEYPFDRLVEDLKVRRDMSRNALFDLMFTLQNAGEDMQEDISSQWNDGQIKELGSSLSKFDIDIVFQESGEGMLFTLVFNPDVYGSFYMKQFMRHFCHLMECALHDSDEPLTALDYLSSAEKDQLLIGFNETAVFEGRGKTVLDLFRQQVDEQPEAIALAFQDRLLSYAELDALSGKFAHFLHQQHPLQADDRVGIHLQRSEYLVISMLAIWKAGAAYVPVDPNYPQDRISYMRQDSNCKLWIDEKFLADFQATQEKLDANFKAENIQPDQLAYLIYTSGSTGQPKGVMIEHRNLVNFIEGMDEPTSLQKGDHLLAITSMSFDISILELIYPICRGVLVSIKPTEADYTGFDIYAAGQQKSIDFSLLFFSSQKADGADKYKLLFDTVRYADDNDFQAVWLPERHFHEFGGIFPNPSVLGASLASTTKQIHIRSGSVVLPLHDSIRVAEEWSVVDNISNGRIGLSIASGWHSNDFIFRPDNFEKRHQSMFAQIEELRSLWKGESIQRTNGVGEDISLRIFPQPIQKELPLWVTSGGNIATFQKAGAIGANVLTHMLGQDIEHLKTNIEAYKTSLRENGFDPAEAKITLMVHTYVGESLEQVKEAVREPFIAYLKSSLGLIKNMLKEFSDDIDNISSEDLDNLLDLAFERYWQTAALFGTEESCREMVDILRLIGITEIACLIDFGLDHQSIVKGLEPLNELRKYYQQQSATKQTSLPPINALQITPSYLKMLSEDAYSRDFLSSLEHLMVGGEAFPQSLADGLSSKTKARISNMYGPTETTIWSSTQAVTKGESITVGKPIQATQFYVLDAQLRLCPLGAIGELYIGGAGVARGYLDRPELTKERFVSNPFDSSLGKIYKTGDLAKWLPDGRIQLLGRADNQVKINGHRIELEEVENVLLQLPQVSNVAVMVQQDEQDNRSLVAYIVTQDSVQSKDLRQFLQDRLPAYMVPTSFLELASIPLTANGKINRKLLAQMDSRSIDSGDDYVQPTNDIEEQLVQIWSDLLKIPAENIGIQSNFFDLGGNSILAIKLLGTINKTFELQISLVDLYTEANIEKLAERIGGKKKELQEEEDQLDLLADTMETAFNKLINNEYE